MSHNHVSKFTIGQLVNVVRGGFTLPRVMISSVTFFVPTAGTGILGSNIETSEESGIKYTVSEPTGPFTFREREVWAWMMELS